MESLNGHYDVVLANIVADVIIPLSRVVPEFLQEVITVLACKFPIIPPATVPPSILPAKEQLAKTHELPPLTETPHIPPA